MPPQAGFSTIIPRPHFCHYLSVITKTEQELNNQLRKQGNLSWGGYVLFTGFPQSSAKGLMATALRLKSSDLAEKDTSSLVL